MTINCIWWLGPVTELWGVWSTFSLSLLIVHFCFGKYRFSLNFFFFFFLIYSVLVGQENLITVISFQWLSFLAPFFFFFSGILSVFCVHAGAKKGNYLNSFCFKSSCQHSLKFADYCILCWESIYPTPLSHAGCDIKSIFNSLKLILIQFTFS